MSEKATAERERWTCLIEHRLARMMGAPAMTPELLGVWRFVARGLSGERLYRLDRLLEAIEEK